MERVIRSDLAIGASECSERPAFASVYVVAGRFICVETCDAELSELMQRYFAGWHVAPVNAYGGIKPDVTLVIRTSDDPPTAPSHLAPFEVAEGGRCRTDASIYFFENHGSTVAAGRLNPSTVEVWIGSNGQARERSPLARLIFNASMAAMRRCGLYELHAAGVVDPAGKGVLVVGPSGSGKSNLAAQLASAGWRYLSDDSVLLFSKNGVVEAHALRRMFALTEEAFSATGGGDTDAIEVMTAPFDPLKKRFEPAPVFPGRFAQSCMPAKVFFSELENAPTSRTRLLNRSETMARLIRMCPWACYDKPTAQAHLEVLAQLARQAKGFELFAGTDLLNSERASEFLLSHAD